MRSEAVRSFAVAALALLLAGCGGDGGGERSLSELVAAERYDVVPRARAAGSPAAAARAAGVPLVLPGEPRAEVVEIDDERRPAVVLPAGGWTWRTTVPDGGRLQVGVGVADGEAVPLEATVILHREGEREVLEVARHGPGEAARWLDLGADLSSLAGREVELEIGVRLLAPSPTGGGTIPALAWAPAALVPAGRPDAAERPNVLFIAIDTLRHDHLTSYGYERDTAPEIERLLAQRGVVIEDAFSQAPWTLPSVLSYLTGRYPGELLGEDTATYGVPEGVPTLAEVFSGLGYATGGFIANAALHRGNGFARGFDTFHSPKAAKALELHADSINRRAIPWLQARQGEPFFLYLHYMDPHDPYWNPDLVDGLSPWFDDPGGPSGRWVHGVYTGRVPVGDIERTVAHFTALYDSEIRYVDRAVGEVLASIPERVLRDTIVVLTSDHGEELYDHGGWKHGHTLYEDQIHVPLLWRWDARIPAGRRLPGTVRLLDVAPTLLAAIGAEAPAAWQGESLLPALLGEEPLGRRAAFAQHLQVGPLRSALVADGEKLILYNREEPFTPANGLQAHLHEIDRGRLARVELYDLDADPGERSNLAAPAGSEGGEGAGGDGGERRRDRIERLARLLYHRLDRSLPGVRALTDRLPAGAVLAGELVFERPPEAAIPLFLAPSDRLEVAGERVRFEIVGDGSSGIDKGFRLTGEPGALLSASLTLDGEPLAGTRLRTGSGRPFGGRRVSASALVAPALPAPGDAPGLRLWSPGREVAHDAEASAETLERLKALGYVE